MGGKITDWVRISPHVVDVPYPTFSQQRALVRHCCLLLQINSEIAHTTLWDRLFGIISRVSRAIKTFDLSCEALKIDVIGGGSSLCYCRVRVS